MSVLPALASGLLWRMRPLSGDCTAEDWNLLSEHERARAAAIAHRAARTRYVVGRALLRRSITELLPQVDAHCHRIIVTSSGHPHVAEQCDVDVSLSHTDGLVVAAVSSVGPIGIDVEPSGRGDLSPTDRWLIPVEQRHLELLAPTERRPCLIGWWVAKEPVLKACDHLVTVTRRSLDVRCGQADVGEDARDRDRTGHGRGRGAPPPRRWVPHGDRDPCSVRLT